MVEDKIFQGQYQTELIKSQKTKQITKTTPI